MFRHLITFLRRWRRTRLPPLEGPPEFPTAKSARPSGRDPVTVPPTGVESGAERDPPSRQRLSWPARDLSRSRRLARAAPDDETVAVRPPPPDPAQEDDDATVVLPRTPGRDTEPH